MALVGFNPDYVYASIRRVQSAYDQLMQALISDTQNGFVNPMGDAWACNDAINFFTTAKDSFDTQIQGATRVFQSVVDAMNSGANAWAQSTETTYSPIQFSPNNGKIDISCIKENISGVRGIDESAAGSAVSYLTGSVKSAADSALQAAVSAVNECGFIGGSQQGNLTSTLSSIQSSISTMFGELTTAAKTAMDATTQAYGSIEANVSNAFAGE